MGFRTGLWTATRHLCLLVQVIMAVYPHWSFMLSVRQKSELARPQLWARNSYCLLTGRSSLAVGGHRDLLPTIGVALLMCILCRLVCDNFERKLKEHGHASWELGSTAAQLLTCVFVPLVALNIFMGLLSGAIVTMFAFALVVTIADMEHAKYCAKGWTPLVDGLCFGVILMMYYGLIGLSALLVSTHSFLGWSLETYFTLAVALLLYSIREQLNWSAVHRLVSQAAVIYVLWKVLSALAVAIHLSGWLSPETVAIHLSGWLSPETFFNLVAASVPLGFLLSFA